MTRLIKWFMKWNARKKFFVLAAYLLYVLFDQVLFKDNIGIIWDHLTLIKSKKSTAT